ncbi:ATP-binding protein [Bacillus sp. DX1.1]|uniref:sensor histidine kinase n=1 Tax=unclassified Bacillus (in: firmicutes) TaxID=185979 RepID=UPI0025712A79|nr:MULTISPECIES: HAMP domain-containing sensor histidine kinase [unclassified Bacillus (in: firmicutes)]MDM5153930.1 ATP-binding protein [Bacillus sp. DX1.1]WJE82864.1 ATP-binding protein [Bacillus sp. DX3.1]
MLTMVQKLWLTVVCAVCVTVSFLYFVSLYSYEKLYVQNIEDSLTMEGKRLVSQYKKDEDITVFEEKVKTFDSISSADLIFVSNPRDLSACLPFEVHYDSLISENDRQTLLDGKIIKKVGYEERFNRNIMGVVIPVLEGKKLVGVVYSYIPLKSIKDLIYDMGFILAPLALVMVLLTIWIGRKIIIAITKPLSQMERVANHMAKGDFSERITITSEDEIGSLGKAFNKMATALETEDAKRKEFLANVSHELRTPLSYIKGYSEAILDGVAKGQQQSKFTQLIHKEAGRMQRLVHDLLDLAQLEGEHFPLKKQPIVFAQLIEDVLETYELKYIEKQLRISANLDPDIIVMIDEDRMQQILHNLLDNAIRYTDHNGSIDIQLKKKDKHCELKIKDTGIGIDPEHLEQLGERFYRVDKARSRQHGGTGLGLAIVKQIVHIHDGSWIVESEKGNGTTVIIQLPIK